MGVENMKSISLITATKNRWHIYGNDYIKWGQLHGDDFFNAFDETFGLFNLELLQLAKAAIDGGLIQHEVKI